MLEQKLSGKSWLKICSSRLDCSQTPPCRKLDWICKENIFIFFHSENQLKKIFCYILLSSHTLTLRSDEVMKLCVEAAMSAAQGWTAVKPPPPPLKVGNWTGFAKKTFSFFSLRKSTEKNILLHITEYSHTLTLRSDEVMKLCVEAAVSAAQGWTAVETPPPPRSRKLDWICKENIFIFFSLRKSTEKNILLHITEYSHTLTLRSDEVMC